MNQKMFGLTPPQILFLVLALAGAVGLALVWTGLALELNSRRYRVPEPAKQAHPYVDPPEEEQTGA
jgi:hypothetical protein